MHHDFNNADHDHMCACALAAAHHSARAHNDQLQPCACAVNIHKQVHMHARMLHVRAASVADLVAIMCIASTVNFA